ncbi:MAG: hypothetical protein ACRDBT_09155 [Aeromonas sp.]
MSAHHCDCPICHGINSDKNSGKSSSSSNNSSRNNGGKRRAAPYR